MAAWFAAGAPAQAPFLFVDVETTGLSGGAGTHAFLVGCGSFDADGSFVTRQFVLTRYVDERALLVTFADVIASAGALVSFNGKSFDAPMLETRYLFHRLEWVGGRVAHLDVLHPARQFWGRDQRGVESGEHHDCSLIALERQIVGFRRVVDVAGIEIPSRYFQFVRTGDARPLVAVLEHNRFDLLTLASLTARLLHLARIGPTGARHAREALALGHVYARVGMDARARAAYQWAIATCGAELGAYDVTKIAALRALALAWRRVRRFEDAANCWRQLLEVRGCPPHFVREATEALAIHHEHRVRDLPTARVFAMRSLEHAPHQTSRDAVHHRLARIDRKLAGNHAAGGDPKIARRRQVRPWFGRLAFEW
jgi:uncharacterized protein YprB with RNaseH-like and TPR domain